MSGHLVYRLSKMTSRFLPCQVSVIGLIERNLLSTDGKFSPVKGLEFPTVSTAGGMAVTAHPVCLPHLSNRMLSGCDAVHGRNCSCLRQPALKLLPSLLHSFCTFANMLAIELCMYTCVCVCVCMHGGMVYMSLYN